MITTYIFIQLARLSKELPDRRNTPNRLDEIQDSNFLRHLFCHRVTTEQMLLFLTFETYKKLTMFLIFLLSISPSLIWFCEDGMTMAALSSITPTSTVLCISVNIMYRASERMSWHWFLEKKMKFDVVMLCYSIINVYLSQQFFW